MVTWRSPVIFFCLSLCFISCAPIAVSTMMDDRRERDLITALRSIEAIDESRSASVGIFLGEDGAIETLIKFSPAYLAGIRENDHLLTIDGISVANGNAQGALIGKPGSRVTVTYRNKRGETQAITIERVAWWSLITHDHLPPREHEIEKRPGY